LWRPNFPSPLGPVACFNPPCVARHRERLFALVSPLVVFPCSDRLSPFPRGRSCCPQHDGAISAPPLVPMELLDTSFTFERLTALSLGSFATPPHFCPLFVFCSRAGTLGVVGFSPGLLRGFRPAPFFSSGSFRHGFFRSQRHNAFMTGSTIFHFGCESRLRPSGFF